MTALLDPVLLLPLGATLLGGWLAVSSLLFVVRGVRRRRAAEAQGPGTSETPDASESPPGCGSLAWNLLLGLFFAGLTLQFAAQLAVMGPQLVRSHGLLGQEAPELAYVELQTAAAATLAEHRGQVVLLNYWATWCPPCRAEMPDLDRLGQDLADEGLVVLHLSSESAETITSWLQKHPMGTLHGRPSGPQLPSPALPTTYVIDRDGTIRELFVGGKSYDTFRDAVRPFL